LTSGADNSSGRTLIKRCRTRSPSVSCGLCLDYKLRNRTRDSWIDSSGFWLHFFHCCSIWAIRKDELNCCKKRVWNVSQWVGGLVLVKIWVYHSSAVPFKNCPIFRISYIIQSRILYCYYFSIFFYWYFKKYYERSDRLRVNKV
jgi:hypothetical protein